MTLPATAVIEVRPAGSGASDLNGGGFDPATGSTDYSQQDSPVLSLSDIACTGSATAVITSATGGFTSLMVGNYLQISSGTGFTATWYRIATFTSSTQVTLDRTPASSASAASGGVGRVGGALASPGMAGAAHVTGNDLHIKSGTYVFSSTTSNVSGGRLTLQGVASNQPTRVFGYGTTRRDGGTKPILQAGVAFASSALVTTAANGWYVENLTFDGQTKTSVRGLDCSTFGTGRAVGCKFLACTNAGMAGTSVSTALSCEFNACTTAAALNTAALAEQCYFTGCTQSATSAVASLRGCVFTACAGVAGVVQGNSAAMEQYEGLTFSGNTASCMVLNGNQTYMASVRNCLFYGTGGWGVTTDSPTARGIFITNCAFGSNTSGDINGSGLTANEVGHVSLTADPFVSAAGGNFALNSTVGGGAACKAAGLGAFPGLSTTVSYPDVGAAQHQDAGGLRRVTMTGGITG